MIDARKLDRRITILQALPIKDPRYGTAAPEWVPLAQAWAEVRDMLPSRAESADQNIDIARRPCRIRMRYREDISAAMRIRVGARVLQIIAGPSEIGRREGIEIMAEEVSTMGDAR